MYSVLNAPSEYAYFHKSKKNYFTRFCCSFLKSFLNDYFIKTSFQYEIAKTIRFPQVVNPSNVRKKTLRGSIVITEI